MKNIKRNIMAAVGSLALLTGAAANTNEVMQQLNLKQQSIVAVAANEATGNLVALEGALNEAFDNGLTLNQLKEELSQLYAYTGFPRSLNALGVLQKVAERRKAQGKPMPETAEPDRFKQGYDALKQGTEVQSRLTGKPYKNEFCDAVDYYLKAHLFGDVFASEVLSYPERELATIGALSSLEGVEPQLVSHVSGSRNMGVTDAQLRGVPAVLAAKVGSAAAYRAQNAVAKVLGDSVPNAGVPTDLPFEVGEANTAYAKYFIGNSYLALLATGEGKLPLSNVTFEPACRNNWHIHHGGGQILICVSGRGWYQAWGEPARMLRPGDVVDIPADVKHWHGAARDSWFQHIALSVPGDNKSNEWLEPVTDEEYNKLP